MSTLRRTLLVTFAGLFLASCSATRPATPLECALIGGMLGGGTGTAIAVGAVDQDEEEAFAGFGIGAATGALIGYTICAVLEDKARRGEPAPVREPVAAPAPVVTKIVVLPGVNFGHDRAELSGDAKAVLRREVVVVLREDPDLTVSVEGHTDSQGAEEYNMALSERRAGVVRDYLLSDGVAAERVAVVGYGEERPIADNATAEGRARNRRVEIKVLE